MIGASNRLALAFGIALMSLGCGGSSPPPEAPPPPAPEAAAPPPAPPPSAAPSAAPAAPAAWKDMNHEQKLDFMKNVVLPKEKEEFSAVDAKRYGTMNCGTCHGAGAKDGSFKMPNPDLPKLTPDNMFKKHMDKSPAMTKFMMTKVVPDTAGLLGAKVYDPTTHQGFGCFACHVMAK